MPGELRISQSENQMHSALSLFFYNNDRWATYLSVQSQY